MNRTELSPYGRLGWALSSLGAGVLVTGLLLGDTAMMGAGLFWTLGFGASAYIEFVKTFPDPDADS